MNQHSKLMVNGHNPYPTSNQSINQSVNQSFNQLINQSINQFSIDEAIILKPTLTVGWLVIIIIMKTGLEWSYPINNQLINQ